MAEEASQINPWWPWIERESRAIHILTRGSWKTTEIGCFLCWCSLSHRHTYNNNNNRRIGKREQNIRDVQITAGIYLSSVLWSSQGMGMYLSHILFNLVTKTTHTVSLVWLPHTTKLVTYHYNSPKPPLILQTTLHIYIITLPCLHLLSSSSIYTI